MQTIIRYENFPEGFGQKSRNYSLSQFDRVVTILNDSEKAIPERLWIDVPAPDQIGYNEMFRQARITLRDEGVYDSKMMTVLRTLRCRRSPEMPECTADDKE